MDSPLSNGMRTNNNQTCFHGEISGLRSMSPPVAIRYRISNYDAQKNVRKNLLLKKKKPCMTFPVRKSTKGSIDNFVESGQMLL